MIALNEETLDFGDGLLDKEENLCSDSSTCVNKNAWLYTSVSLGTETAMSRSQA